MSKYTFDIIYDKIKNHAKIVWLYDQGEPFLNPDLLYMVKKLTDHNIFVQLDSNLAVRKFSSRFADELVRSKLHHIRISADGVSQDTYAIYRVGGKIDHVFYNIEALIVAKKKYNSDYPVMTWKFLISRFNEHEIDIAKALAKKWQIEIVYEVMISEDPSWYSKRYNLETNELPENWAPEEYEDINIGLEYAKIWRPHHFLHPCCSQPLDTMIINRNGLVFPCCSAPQYNHYVVGDIISEAIEDIWNNRMLSECRSFVRNYGNKIQNTNSICERFPCMISKKSLSSEIPLYSVPDTQLLSVYDKLPDLYRKKMIVWGIDKACFKRFSKLLDRAGEMINVIGFVDDSLKHAQEIDKRYPCYKPLQLRKIKPDVFLISSQKHLGLICRHIDVLGFESCERYYL